MESVCGSLEGHEASIPGLYASDSFDYGIGHYGWPKSLFDDGMFYRCGFIIQAEHNTKKHEKNKGTIWHEVVYPAAQVYIVGLVVLPDAELDRGQARFYDFVLRLETIPHG